MNNNGIFSDEFKLSGRMETSNPSLIFNVPHLPLSLICQFDYDLLIHYHAINDDYFEIWYDELMSLAEENDLDSATEAFYKLVLNTNLDQFNDPRRKEELANIMTLFSLSILSVFDKVVLKGQSIHFFETMQDITNFSAKAMEEKVFDASFSLHSQDLITVGHKLLVKQRRMAPQQVHTPKLKYPLIHKMNGRLSDMEFCLCHDHEKVKLTNPNQIIVEIGRFKRVIDDYYDEEKLKTRQKILKYYSEVKGWDLSNAVMRELFLLQLSEHFKAHDSIAEYEYLIEQHKEMMSDILVAFSHQLNYRVQGVVSIEMLLKSL
ncbi:hypothetical protein HJ030_17690 [Vibrio parahaemolyticus]|nr:hypothetical protein [Vibrio parahaemolyticus]